MFGRKGIDGTYYAVCLFLGLIFGIGLVYFALSNGTLTGLFCPAAPVAPF